MSVRVVVVDDQALVRTGFSAILSTEGDIEVVGEAADGAAALVLCEQVTPDVVLMDIRMPVMDGVEATRQLMASQSPPRVLILTTFDLDDLVHSALQAGASGFLLKDALPNELVHAIKVVAAGDAMLAPSVTRRLIAHFAAHGSPALTSGREAAVVLDQLTDREREVLRLMARGLSNVEIAEASFVAETTVKTHVGRIFMKLNVRDRVQAVVVAYDAGLVLPGVSE
jgi:DNA-binding NarL/FixJ family response regulator